MTQSDPAPGSTRATTRAAAVLGAWVALGLLSSLDSYLLTIVEGQPAPHFGRVLVRQMPRWLLWAALTPVVLWLGRQFPFRRERWWVPVGFHAAAGTAVALLHLALTFILMVPTLPDTGPIPEGWRLFGLFLTSQLHFGLLGYGTILGAGFAVDYHRRLRARDLREAGLHSQLVEARLRSLQNRLHPHFLFNTLHAASVLVDERPADAQRVLSRLGDLLRDLLERTETLEVSLDRELELLRPYLDVQKIRFHDRLRIRTDVGAEAKHARLPSFLLQPLVENAIRHGIEARAGSGTIDIRAERTADQLVVEVVNTHVERPSPPDTWRDGVGLAVTRERLEKTYGAGADLTFQVEEGRTVASIVIPWGLVTSESSDQEGEA